MTSEPEQVSSVPPSVEVVEGDSAAVAGGVKESKDPVTMVHTEQEWERLVHTLGLVVVDIFNTWCGPCTAMDFHLKRLKVASVEGEDKVSLARACCDEIEELAPFRTDPRPTWLFLSSGIPTALLRGANRPLLSKLFLSELEQEREGRLPVYIDYKSPSVIQCVGPLGNLAQDKTVQSIGSGRTEMLSNLFQERVVPTPQPPKTPGDSEAQATGSAEEDTAGEDGQKEDPIDREIVDILLAADLEGELGQEDDYEDLYDEDERVYTGDGSNPNLVTKPKKKLELRAGLLREILSNKPKRHTFSGLYL